MSHRGFDQGSKDLGRTFAIKFNTLVIMGKFSSLLIDLNRSARHPNAFSEISSSLSTEVKKSIIKTYHAPHWEKIQKILEKKTSKDQLAIHIGVHSFTPVLNNEIRNADIGILYDPSRKAERQMALRWKKSIEKRSSDLSVRLNYPYLGKLDGLTTQLRKKYNDKNYLGIELEVNHRLIENKLNWRKTKQILLESLSDIL